MEKMKVGVIGCGNISRAYFNAGKNFKFMEYACCADMNMEAAEKLAEEYGTKAVTVDELLADKSIDAILNLTIPQAHVEVNMAALNAGKHVYCEKPFGLCVESARPVIELAKQRGLRVGCAPDTFLGGSHQTCRKLIDDGWIGKPLSGVAFMVCPGHESWHPNPGFYYLNGGGPLFDMGPYYITALINMLGPVKKVAAMGMMGFDQRVCTSEERFGDVLPVEVNTHVAGTLEFHCGAVITMIMSFDVAQSTLPRIELHGTAGSLLIPDPNCFGGEIMFARARKEFQSIAVPYGYTDNMRSIGLADMLDGIMNNRDHRASGERAFHALEVMCALEQSAKEERFVALETICERPAALPLGLLHGALA